MSVVPSALQEQVPSQEGSQTPQVAEVPKAEAPPQESLARHFAALSKKEKALFREREAIKAERAAIAADKARIAEMEAKYGVKPSSPREALERYGFDYKQATEFELNDGAPTAEHMARQAQEEVKRFREEQAARDQRLAQEAAERADQEKAEVIVEFKSEIKEFVTEKADEYEFIRFHDAYDVVFHTIEEHYARTGKLLSIPEGANMVEKYLEKKMEGLRATKKFAKTRQGDPPPPESGFSRQPEPSAPRRTLDNTVTASTTPTLVKSSQVENDRVKRALAALDRR